MKGIDGWFSEYSVKMGPLLIVEPCSWRKFTSLIYFLHVAYNDFAITRVSKEEVYSHSIFSHMVLI